MKVVRKFYCKETKKIYDVGDDYHSDNPKRLEFLQESGFLAPDQPNYQSMTKIELGELLTEKGIEFNPKQPKAELIDLLR